MRTRSVVIGVLLLGMTTAALGQSTIIINGRTYSGGGPIVIIDGKVVAGAAPDAITEGTGNLKSEARELPVFNEVVVATAARVKVTVSRPAQGQEPGPKVVVTADDNILPLVQTVAGAQRLRIFAQAPFRTSQPPLVTIEIAALRKAEIQGAGTIELENIAGETLLLQINGSGSITAEGEVKRLVSEVNGSGALRLSSLRAAEGQVTVNGSGSADVRVTARLTLDVNGSGDITYYGSPREIRSNVHGAGTIRAR